MVACAPSASRLDTTGLSNVTTIRSFQPDKGENAAYTIGQQVSFSYTLGRAGFITLIAFDDNGRIDDLERDALVRAITEASGNLSVVARKLGVARSTIYRMKRRYELP